MSESSATSRHFDGGRFRTPAAGDGTPRVLRVLIVEDDDLDARIVERALAEEPGDLFRAERVRTLAEALKRADVDAVILDLTLPDSRGLATFRAMRAQAPQAAIVVLTMVADHGLALAALAEGAQDYLIKGETRPLALATRYAVERHRSAQEGRRDPARLDAFAAIAHDLRNPMQVIQAVSRLLLRGAELPPEQRRDLMTSLNRNVRQLAYMVDNALEAARLEEHPTASGGRVFDLVELARTTVEDLMHHDPHARLVFNAPATVPDALGDPQRQWRILSNLVTNAVKFSAPGAPVTVSIDRAGALLQVTVRDRGRGIAPDERRRLFQRFARQPDDTTPGTGLGLYIVRRLVEADGGTIEVDSVLGQGSTFTYTVPVASPPPH